MNNQTQKALKMAIEMLSNYKFEKGREVINACKEALQSEASEQSQSAMMDVVKYGQSVMLAGKNIPLESIYVQEPVAYISEIGLGRLKHGDYRHGTVAQVSKERLFDTDFELYLHPHQWQGLTDDEIDKCGKGLSINHWPVDFARAIEQALKEKNHD